MEKIQFSQVVPQVFASRTSHDSDVWQQEVVFEKGHTYLVEASSGRGKSTFCSYILGYRHDFTGSISFDDQPTGMLKVSDWVRLRQQHLSYMFQELRLFPELTAWENVEIKNRLTKFKPHQQIESWFEQLGLVDKKEQKVARMSFGQQQRVALLRALVQPFDFLLADEPVSHLDDVNASIMGRILIEEANRQGAAVIITSIGKHMDITYDKTLRL